MRPVRSRSAWAAARAGVCLALAGPVAVAAQGSVGSEGGAFLLRPVGARAVGMGQAVVARRDGGESLWWNPAGLAWMTKREGSLHHSQDFFATGDVITLVVPSTLLGVFSLAADLENFGEQENTSDPGAPPTGTILTRSLVLNASYATRIGGRAATGIAFTLPVDEQG